MGGSIPNLDGLTWPSVRKAALAYAADPPKGAVRNLVTLFGKDDWESRFFAVNALGPIAARQKSALTALQRIADCDVDWQVNEGLAFAFDDYCAAIGYEQALPEIRAWLAAPSVNRNRAVTEGLRRWTDKRRMYFHHHPREAVALIGSVRAKDSQYLQKSVGNAMRDIWRAHPELVEETIARWLAEAPDDRGLQRIANLALRDARPSGVATRRARSAPH